MRNLLTAPINKHRITDPVILQRYGGWPGDETCGAFRFLYRGEMFQAIASIGMGWEHVSVSHKKRVPSWNEMCHFKSLFWEPEECVVQYHPPESEYVNTHPNALHLWKPTDAVMPRPPKWMV